MAPAPTTTNRLARKAPPLAIYRACKRCRGRYEPADVQPCDICGQDVCRDCATVWSAELAQCARCNPTGYREEVRHDA